MGRDPDFDGAVPNSWMASPPGHPFWLLPVLDVIHYTEEIIDIAPYERVEHVTGPSQLDRMIKQYVNDFRHESLRRYVCERIEEREPTWEFYCNRGNDMDADDEEIRDALILLPEKQIYPYSWRDDGLDSVCMASENARFDSEECKKLMDVEAWPSYFITYCTSSWN
jgi:hypothetical protein